MIDVQGLRALIAVADAGSVTAAAALLHYTPSNVTQRVQRLEHAVGAPLLERVGRGVVLTELARRLVDEGRPAVLRLHDLAEVVASDRPAGRVRVAAFPTALRGLVVPLIATLRDTCPAVRIEPVEREPADATRQVRLGLADVAVVKSWGAAPTGHAEPDLHREVLGHDAVDVILPADHPLGGRSRLTWVDLVDESWAVTPDDDPYRRWLESTTGLGRSAGTVYEAAEFQSLLAFVERGLAIAALPRLGRGPLPPQTVAVPLADETAFREIAAIARTPRRDGATIRAVLDGLRHEMVEAVRVHVQRCTTRSRAAVESRSTADPQGQHDRCGEDPSRCR
ncbi:DNA-binding transcriptional LysR family regulator [Microbacterium sp. SORGH_AS 1204]|uniref:LysR family transcriptional regulator n=1 Tax=Microbacterium sp. SORGH_AS_1204 TaxID=3041785 RepID=UPI002792B863|nr:LysR family transcriptional regulator [Microbacterium sp. SORGH_AS_1204]MDQ1137771.1 DNA-binding transcriptional LysR family regulator [Microbacterium sp. SORGH_AS_1204]